MYYMLKTLGEGGVVDNTRIDQPVCQLTCIRSATLKP